MAGKMYFVVLLALINFSVCKIALCENVELRSQLEPEKSKTSPDDQILETISLSSMTRPVNEAPIQDTIFRWAESSGDRYKCNIFFQCTGNHTLFENIHEYCNCYCDNACYETFQDCCPDFVKTCGEQKKTNTKNSQPLWKCLAVGNWDLTHYNLYESCYLYGLSGIWMIANCSKNWALNETRTRCENAPAKFSFPVEDFLPVVGKNGFTYRNKHCAECNEETSYETWRIAVQGSTTPPEQYNLDDQLRFVLGNGGEIVHIGPGWGVPRRYCAGVRYKDNCLNTSHSAYNDCLNGAVEMVRGWERRYFKSHACALCNGEWAAYRVRDFESCYSYYAPEAFSTVFNAQKQPNSNEITVNKLLMRWCYPGMIYDDFLELCREGVISYKHNTLSDVFFVALWFKSSATKISTKTNNITNHFKSALVSRFVLQPNQLTAFQFHWRFAFIIATFHLTLTPYQEFILANKNDTSNLNISAESQKFLGLLKFTTEFTMGSGDYRFPVIKLVSKQLACFQGRKLQSHEYEVDKISGNVIQNTTGKVFSKNDYEILGKFGENITICRRLVLSGCHNDALVTLYEHEYFVYKNLTIFHYQTNRTFNFGEYQIIEGSSHQINLDIFQNASFPRNSAIAICLPFPQTFNATEKIKVH